MCHPNKLPSKHTDNCPNDFSGEIQKGTGGTGQDRKCNKLSQIVVTFYDKAYNDLWRVLCQWNKVTEIVIKCRSMS